MNIEAYVYLIADSREGLENAMALLTKKQRVCFRDAERFEPSAVLPLQKTWYGVSSASGPAGDPHGRARGWQRALRECAALLRRNGAAVVRFWCPDAPESYGEYAYTTPGAMYISKKTGH